MNLPPPLPTDPPNHSEWRLLVSAGSLMLLGDYLLWAHTPGLSLAIYSLVAMAAVLLNRVRAELTPGTVICSALLTASAIQSVIEISLSNLLVIGALLLVLIGESAFPTLRAGWQRWSEAAWNFVIAPFHWGWMMSLLYRAPWLSAWTRHHRWLNIITRVALPTATLGIIYLILLGNGNAIFANAIRDLFTNTWDYMPSFSLSFGRVVFWAALAIFVLGLLRPAATQWEARPSERPWCRALPSFRPPSDLTIARWRNYSIVALLNAIFFSANTIDAVYLWREGQLPAGVNYSDYVHQGVYSLIAAVLLSALVLVAIYQQAPETTAGKVLRGLSLLWIGQNLILLTSVLLRLKLYINVYQLTEQRLYVSAFLLLVATGFALLAWRILRSKSLNWLLFANVCATFTLFFTMQWLDVARFVADQNVARWHQERHRNIDVEYLGQLGPSAYPALERVAATPLRAEANEARLLLKTIRDTEKNRLATYNWRSLQLRHLNAARNLLGDKNERPKISEKTPSTPAATTINTRTTEPPPGHDS